MKNERELQGRCLKWARLQGVFGRKVETPAYIGFPDCLFLYKGRVLLVEFKHPNGTGKLSPLQERDHERLAAVDVKPKVIDSFDAFKCLIRGWMNEHAR